MKTETGSSSGVGVLGLLGVAFIVLRLTHYIDWSWWWVLGPFWIPLALVVLIATIAAVFKVL